MFNGKPVWKQDNFTYEAVKVGDYNVAPDGYFQRIVKPCLLDLRKRKDDAKTDMERGYYEDRYAAQAKDFAQALHISAEALDELIGGV